MIYFILFRLKISNQMGTCRFWNQLDFKNVHDKYFYKINLWKINPQNGTKKCANLQFLI